MRILRVKPNKGTTKRAMINLGMVEDSSQVRYRAQEEGQQSVGKGTGQAAPRAEVERMLRVGMLVGLLEASNRPLPLPREQATSSTLH